MDMRSRRSAEQNSYISFSPLAVAIHPGLPRPLKVAIVGAGTGGLATAIALQFMRQVGHKVGIECAIALSIAFAGDIELVAL